MKWILLIFLTNEIGVFIYPTEETCKEESKLIKIINGYQSSYCVKENSYFGWNK